MFIGDLYELQRELAEGLVGAQQGQLASERNKIWALQTTTQIKTGALDWSARSLLIEVVDVSVQMHLPQLDSEEGAQILFFSEIMPLLLFV